MRSSLSASVGDAPLTSKHDLCISPAAACGGGAQNRPHLGGPGCSSASSSGAGGQDRSIPPPLTWRLLSVAKEQAESAPLGGPQVASLSLRAHLPQVASVCSAQVCVGVQPHHESTDGPEQGTA